MAHQKSNSCYHRFANSFIFKHKQAALEILRSTRALINLREASPYFKIITTLKTETLKAKKKPALIFKTGLLLFYGDKLLS